MAGFDRPTTIVNSCPLVFESGRRIPKIELEVSEADRTRSSRTAIGVHGGRELRPATFRWHRP